MREYTAPQIAAVLTGNENRVTAKNLRIPHRIDYRPMLELGETEPDIIYRRATSEDELKNEGFTEEAIRAFLDIHLSVEMSNQFHLTQPERYPDPGELVFELTALKARNPRLFKTFQAASVTQFRPRAPQEPAIEAPEPEVLELGMAG